MSSTEAKSIGGKYHVYDNPRPVKRLKIDPNRERRWLVFGGATGWVGQMIVKILSSGTDKVFAAMSRLENRKDIIAEIENLQPTHVVNAAGLTELGLAKATPNIEGARAKQLPDQVDPNIF